MFVWTGRGGAEGERNGKRERERNSPGRSSAPRMLPCSGTALPDQRGVRIRCGKQQGAEHEGLILNNKGQEHAGLRERRKFRAEADTHKEQQEMCHIDCVEDADKAAAVERRRAHNVVGQDFNLP